MAVCLVVRRVCLALLTWDCYIGEQRVKNTPWLLTCSFFKGGLNSCLFLLFLKSKHVSDTFPNKNYFACHINIIDINTKKFQFFAIFYYLSINSRPKYNYFLKRERERQLTGLSCGSFLI